MAHGALHARVQVLTRSASLGVERAHRPSTQPIAGSPSITILPSPSTQATPPEHEMPKANYLTRPRASRIGQLDCRRWRPAPGLCLLDSAAEDPAKLLRRRAFTLRCLTLSHLVHTPRHHTKRHYRALGKPKNSAKPERGSSECTAFPDPARCSSQGWRVC